MVRAHLFIEHWLGHDGIYTGSHNLLEQMEVVCLVQAAWAQTRLVVPFRLPTDQWCDRWEPGDAKSGMLN